MKTVAINSHENADWLKTPETRKRERKIHDWLARRIEEQRKGKK